MNIYVYILIYMYISLYMWLGRGGVANQLPFCRRVGRAKPCPPCAVGWCSGNICCRLLPGELPPVL